MGSSEGKATVTKIRKVFDLVKGESIDISIGEIHRLENKTKKNVKIIEIQTGTYLVRMISLDIKINIKDNKN